MSRVRSTSAQNITSNRGLMLCAAQNRSSNDQRDEWKDTPVNNKNAQRDTFADITTIIFRDDIPPFLLQLGLSTLAGRMRSPCKMAHDDNGANPKPPNLRYTIWHLENDKPVINVYLQKAHKCYKRGERGDVGGGERSISRLKFIAHSPFQSSLYELNLTCYFSLHPRSTSMAHGLRRQQRRPALQANWWMSQTSHTSVEKCKKYMSI